MRLHSVVSFSYFEHVHNSMPGCTNVQLALGREDVRKLQTVEDSEKLQTTVIVKMYKISNYSLLLVNRLRFSQL